MRLHNAGLTRTRVVFQLWNPGFRPSSAQIGGRGIELLLVSSMQIHAEAAYQAIRDAWQTTGVRPLIIAGGPKAQYEPYDFWLAPDLEARAAPDVVVTGESYVLLDLLNVLVQHRGRGEHMRHAFERARREGALADVPGLFYLAPGASLAEPQFVDTGLQRLVQHFDELPGEVVGFGLLEPPHRREGLAAAPLAASEVRKHCVIASLQTTQGCKFTCSYCPIPAANQKTWRFRSPDNVAEQIRSVHERFGIREFFGTDDNFFNRRETAEQILTAMAEARIGSVRLGERIAFMTEATEFDAHKNRDLLPLARAAGMRALWFGIEDLTATLVKKGQSPERTVELFRLLLDHGIKPHAMMMFHDGQPFYSRGSPYGLLNQVEFLRRAGALTIQWTAHMPAVGTREYEKTYQQGRVIERLGRYRIRDRHFDANHIVVTGQAAGWKRQLQMLGGYAAFYNPWNLVRAFRTPETTSMRRRRMEYQLLGMVASVWTIARMLPYTLRLLTARVECHRTVPSTNAHRIHYPPRAHPRVPQAS